MAVFAIIFGLCGIGIGCPNSIASTHKKQKTKNKKLNDLINFLVLDSFFFFL